MENVGAVQGYGVSDHRGIGQFARPRGGRAIAFVTLAVGGALAGCAPGPAIVMPSPRASPTSSAGVADPVPRPAPLPSEATVTGDIRLLERTEGGVELGPIVVSLIPRHGALAPTRTDAPIVVASRGETFAPALAAIPAGRNAVFANDGPLAHAIFSADLPETRVDVPPGGRSAPVRIPPIGPVRFYCSLHSDETFVLYGGAGHIAVVRTGESFSFTGVEGGRYTLAIWSELVSGPVREIVVDGLSHAVEPIWIDPDLVRSRDGGAEDR